MTKARDLANLLGGGTSGVATFGGTAAIRVPNGTTEQRPTAAAGMIRYNTTVSKAEVYDGTIWAPFGSAPPTISTVSPETYNGESGTTFTITGTNLSSDATVFFITSGGTEVQAATVSVVSATEITATTPQDFTVADEPLDVKVVQSSGTATKLDAIDCGGVPTWNTSSGQIGGVIYEGDAVSTSLSASDPDSGATISYSVASGTLPSGLSLNSSTGAITGSAPSVASDTTYNFTAAATDNAGNSTARAFSIIIKNDLLPVTDFFGDGSGKALYLLNNSGADASGSFSATGSHGTPAYDSTNKRFGSHALLSPISNGSLILPSILNAYPFTVSAWVSASNWSPGDGNYEIMNGSIAGQRITLTYSTYPGYPLRPMIMYGGVTHDGFTGFSGTNGLNNWYHFVYVVVGSDSASSTIYVNGSALTRVRYGGAHGGTAGWALGSNAEGAERFMGNIDQVRVFNKALSAQEVSSLYSFENGR